VFIPTNQKHCHQIPLKIEKSHDSWNGITLIFITNTHWMDFQEVRAYCSVTRAITEGCAIKIAKGKKKSQVKSGDSQSEPKRVKKLGFKGFGICFKGFETQSHQKDFPTTTLSQVEDWKVLELQRDILIAGFSVLFYVRDLWSLEF